MAMSKSPLPLDPQAYQPSCSSSSPQFHNDHDTYPTPSSAIKARRRNSLRLSLQPPSVPVPPSLLQSPYLNAHKPKEQATSHVPSEEEDFWLQDQVPLSAPRRGRPHSVPPLQQRQTMSSILHQSPPITPPVRPSSVLIAGLGERRPPPSTQGKSSISARARRAAPRSLTPNCRPLPISFYAVAKIFKLCFLASI